MADFAATCRAAAGGQLTVHVQFNAAGQCFAKPSCPMMQRLRGQRGMWHAALSPFNCIILRMCVLRTKMWCVARIGPVVVALPASCMLAACWCCLVQAIAQRHVLLDLSNLTNFSFKAQQCTQKAEMSMTVPHVLCGGLVVDMHAGKPLQRNTTAAGT